MPTRKTNAGLARNYDSYLANLKDSGRGVKSDKEADRLIKQANQTKAYIVFLNKQSSDGAISSVNRQDDLASLGSARIRALIEADRVAQLIDFRAGPDFMLEGNIADPKDRADGENFGRAQSACCRCRCRWSNSGPRREAGRRPIRPGNGPAKPRRPGR